MIIICVQARMGSSRLPGKPLLRVLGRPLLSYMLERLQSLDASASLVLLTTTLPTEQPLLDIAASLGVATFRGSEENVLERFTLASRYFRATTVVRICGDCPLLDPLLIRQALALYHAAPRRYDYLSNTLERSYPRGMDIEVFSADALEKAYRNAHASYQQEHVTPYLYENPSLFSLGQMSYSQDLSSWRLTLDTYADFQVIAPLLAALYPGNPLFTFEELVAVAQQHPEWLALNAHVHQKTLQE